MSARFASAGKRNTDFLFVYEVKARELENICLIAAHLQKSGYSVSFLNSWDCLQNPAKLLQTSCRVVVISAGYNTDVIEYFANHTGGYNYIVNLQWEQLMTSDAAYSKDYIWYFKGLAHSIAHISWGPWNYDRLTRFCGIPEENVSVCGSVALDFLRPNLLPLLMDREELFAPYGLSQYKKISLFISSFTLIDLPEEEKAGVAKARNIDGMEEFSRRSQQQILDWFLHFLKDHPEQAIIYRPHPAEANNPGLHRLAQMHTNFYVIGEHSIKHWIKNCDMMYTWFSTSLGEIWAAGKSCAILRPAPWRDGQDLVVHENADFVTTYEQFEQIQSSDAYHFPMPEQEIHRFYAVDPQELAASKAARTLIACLEKNLCDQAQKEIDESRALRVENAKNELRDAVPYQHVLNWLSLHTPLGRYRLKNRRQNCLKRIDKEQQAAHTRDYTRQMVEKNCASEQEIRKLIQKYSLLLTD